MHFHYANLWHEKRILSINIELLTYMNIYPCCPDETDEKLCLFGFFSPIFCLLNGYIWFKWTKRQSPWNPSLYIIYVYREDEMQWIQIFFFYWVMDWKVFLHSRNLQWDIWLEYNIVKWLFSAHKGPCTENEWGEKGDSLAGRVVVSDCHLPRLLLAINVTTRIRYRMKNKIGHPKWSKEDGFWNAFLSLAS